MKTLLSLIAVAILMFSSFSSPAKAIFLFDDVFATHSFAYEIAYLYEEGINSGYPLMERSGKPPISRLYRFNY